MCCEKFFHCIYFQRELEQLRSQLRQSHHAPSDQRTMPDGERWTTHVGNVKISRFNSLGPSDAIWRQRSGSPLAQVMACCLKAPSHYLNQCWLIMNLMLWHPPENNSIGISQNINSINEFENHNFKIITVSPRGQWVNSLRHHRCGSTFDWVTACCLITRKQFHDNGLRGPPGYEFRGHLKK